MKPFFPWRFISPRRGYFNEIKIAKACPEVKHLIDKAAFYKFCERLTMVPIAIVFVIVIPFVYFVAICKKILQNIPPIFPDFNNLRREVIDEIHEKIPIDELRRRAGLTPLRATTIYRNGQPISDEDNKTLNHVEEV